MLSPVFLLALTEQDQPMLAWWVIGALITIGPAMLSYIKIYEFFKGKTIDASQFVTKQELATLKVERDQQISNTVLSIKADISNLVKTVDELKSDHKSLRDALNEDVKILNHALGTVEGELPPKPARKRRRT